MKYLFIILFLFLSSCKLLHESSKKKDSSESTSASQKTVQQSAVDTSRGSTEKTSTKETTFYPQPIIIPATDSKPAQVIFVPQSEKVTTNEKEEWWMNKIIEIIAASRDTTSNKQEIKEKQSETEVKTDWMQIAILSLLALLVLKFYLGGLPAFIKQLKLKTNEQK